MKKSMKNQKHRVCKLLIISHEFPPKLGGAGTIAKLLFDAFEKKHQVEVRAVVGCNSQPNNNIIVNYSHPKFWPFSYKKFLKDIDDYDVIICNDSVSIYFAGKYFNKKQLDKVFCFIHGAEKYLEGGKILPFMIGFKYYYKRAFTSARVVNFVSHFIKDYFNIKYTLASRNAVVIHSGIESDMQPKEVKSIVSDEFNFFTACRIVEGKGLKTKLNLLRKMCELYGITVNWTIAGDGAYLEEFKSLVSEQIPSNLNVTCLGRVNRYEMAEYMRGYQFYILLSDLEESFGLSYLEAANLGLIPIGYKKYGVQEAFDAISFGILLDSDLPLEAMADTLFSEMGRIPESLYLKRNSNDFLEEVFSEVQSIALGRQRVL